MRPEPRSPLQIGECTVTGVQVLVMSGVLDSTTYLPVRDRIIKAALDHPAAVVVDITELVAAQESAWSVFTSARWHLATWPEIPVALVSADEAERHALARNAITRYLPVYDTVEAAVSASESAPQRVRRRARTDLPADTAAVRVARSFVVEWLTAWSHAELIPAASVVVTALVGNVVRHTDSTPRLRLESDGVKVTVAVEDADRSHPALQEQVGGDVRPTGLQMVVATSLAWGTSPLPDGKVVWAVVGPEKRL